MLRIVPRTATASGAGTQTATGQATRARIAAAAGVGAAAVTGLHIAPRTATAAGTGTQVAAGLHIAPRTATAAGTGSQVCVGARIERRTASATGTGTSATTTVKLFIFRTPATTEIRPADRNDLSVAGRLFRYAEPTYSGSNVYKLTDGTYTTVEQREYDRIVKVYWGGSKNFVTAAEKADLVAAGYGDYVT